MRSRRTHVRQRYYGTSGSDIYEMDRTLAAFGHSLKTLRQRRGISQEGLARRCFLYSRHVSGFERGENMPYLATLMLLARGLGVTAGELIEDVPVPRREASTSHALAIIATTPGMPVSELARIMALPAPYVFRLVLYLEVTGQATLSHPVADALREDRRVRIAEGDPW